MRCNIYAVVVTAMIFGLLTNSFPLVPQRHLERRELPYSVVPVDGGTETTTSDVSVTVTVSVPSTVEPATETIMHTVTRDPSMSTSTLKASTSLRKSRIPSTPTRTSNGLSSQSVFSTSTSSTTSTTSIIVSSTTASSLAISTKSPCTTATYSYTLTTCSPLTSPHPSKTSSTGSLPSSIESPPSVASASIPTAQTSMTFDIPSPCPQSTDNHT